MQKKLLAILIAAISLSLVLAVPVSASGDYIDVLSLNLSGYYDYSQLIVTPFQESAVEYEYNGSSGSSTTIFYNEGYRDVIIPVRYQIFVNNAGDYVLSNEYDLIYDTSLSGLNFNITTSLSGSNNNIVTGIEYLGCDYESGNLEFNDRSTLDSYSINNKTYNITLVPSLSVRTDSGHIRFSNFIFYVRYKVRVWLSGDASFSGRSSISVSQSGSITNNVGGVYVFEASRAILEKDNTNTSGNLSSAAAENDNAESAAHSAIEEAESALGNYDDSLDTIERFNTGNFFNSQYQAVSFWRDLGNFILDSNNLGFVSTGLIIVTLITLFVFLLRL